MINGRTLLATLESQQTGKRRISVWGIVGRAMLALVAIAVVGGTLAFIAYRLWLGWQTGQWDGFWMLTLNGIFYLLLPVFALIPLFNQQQRLAPALPALRQIAAAREDALTPPVVPQPIALPPESLPIGAPAIGPLKRLVAANTYPSVRLFPFAMLLVMLPIIFLLTSSTDFELGPLLPFPIDLFGSASSAFLFPLAMGGFYAVIIGALVLGFVLRARAGWATMSAYTDAEGIRWRAGRTSVERRIAWRDARSFSRLTTTLTTGVGAYAALTATPGVVYLLDGPDASLMWSLAPTAIDSHYSASEYLCRLIVSRTGLPLRDLTVAANDLAATRGNVQRLMLMRSVMGSGVTASPTLQALAQTPPARPQRVWPRVVSAFALSLIPLLLSAAIFGYGGYVENYQQGYFASLPQRLHGEMPIYTDSMNLADSDWPVGAPTQKAPQGERFIHNDYQLYGTDPTQGNWVWTIGPGVVSNAAFEVTTTERGPITNGASDGIGLIFNIDQAGNNFNLFQVNANGAWILYAFHYDVSDPSSSWNWVADGTSAAIHKGIGATNTLLVIKRGKDVLLYANNTFIEAYYDRDNQLASQGYVGLFLSDDAQTGDFSNIGVYPVKASPSLWYV